MTLHKKQKPFGVIENCILIGFRKQKKQLFRFDKTLTIKVIKSTCNAWNKSNLFYI